MVFFQLTPSHEKVLDNGPIAKESHSCSFCQYPSLANLVGNNNNNITTYGEEEGPWIIITDKTRDFSISLVACIDGICLPLKESPCSREGVRCLCHCLEDIGSNSGGHRSRLPSPPYGKAQFRRMVPLQSCSEGMPCMRHQRLRNASGHQHPRALPYPWQTELATFEDLHHEPPEETPNKSTHFQSSTWAIMYNIDGSLLHHIIIKCMWKFRISDWILCTGSQGLGGLEI